MNHIDAWGRVSLAVTALAVWAAAAPAQTFSSLASFTGANGNLPIYVTLAQGTDGNLYGTTNAGGSNGIGNVFKITAAGVLNTVYSFTGSTDGSFPEDGLVLGIDGNFYGTTSTAGNNGVGTVFKVTPAGAITTLHSFSNATEGGNAFGGLVLGGGGQFYGSTLVGGPGGNGTLFRIGPAGYLTDLYGFTGASDGGLPFATMIEDNVGNFYGTTKSGGTYGAGTIYKLTPAGTFSSVYSFTGGADGGQPVGGVALGVNQNLYVTTSAGGASNKGAVTEVTPGGAATPLYSFTGGADGAMPTAGLILANDGNFYGTTQAGGTSNKGTIFMMTGGGTLTSLYSFSGGVDGASPFGGMMQATDGNLYGTTYQGGTSGIGTVFKVSAGLPQLVKTVPHFATVGSPVLLLATKLGGVSAVQFNGTSASFTLVSPTEIMTTVPSGATTGRITVFANGQIFYSGGPFVVVPTISGFSPTSGPVGTPVVITGQTFTGATAVTFGGVPATSFTVNSYTQITATVPAGAVTGRIGILTPSGPANSTGTFTVN